MPTLPQPRRIPRAWANWIGLPVESVPPALGAAAIVFYVGIVRPDPTETMRWPLAASFAQIGIAFSGVAAAVLVLAGIAAGLSSSPAGVATERSVVLAISAVALAAIAKSRRDPVFMWLSYGALVAGGIKLALENFAVSPPAGMFVAFGAYGVALMMCSRFRKQLESDPVSTTSADPAHAPRRRRG
jgi:hypothetical protein